LEKAYQEGKLAAAWGLQSSPSQIGGLGPFRLKEYVPGQRLALERNPYYWKVTERETGFRTLTKSISSLWQIKMRRPCVSRRAKATSSVV
jgi:peptide/nickel transport system substrate-binding protein